LHYQNIFCTNVTCAFISLTVAISSDRLLHLPPSKRAPRIRHPVNPFGFRKVFRRRTLGLLVAATWLTATTEAKNTTDVFQLWLGQGINLSVAQARNVTVGYGVVMLLSGKYIAPAMIRALGPRRFTTISLVSQAAAFGLWGGVRGSIGSLLGGLALLLPSINATSSKFKNDSIEVFRTNGPRDTSSCGVQWSPHDERVRVCRKCPSRSCN
jgi:hypothetical protein